MIDYKNSNNKRLRYIFVILVNSSKYLWGITIKNKNSRKITEDFSKILGTSKRSPPKIESDRGAELSNNIFQNFLKAKNIQYYSRITDKGPSLAERVIKTIRNLLKKPVFEKGKANWISEIPSVLQKFKNTFHSSITITPNQASRNINEREVYNNLKDNREFQKPKFLLGDLVRTADIKRVFSKGDSTNWSYKLNIITQTIHDTFSSYRIDYLPERYNENLLLPTKLSLDGINKVMKELNLFQ